MIKYLRNIIKLIWLPVLVGGVMFLLTYFIILPDYQVSYKSTTSLYVGKNYEQIEEAQEAALQQDIEEKIFKNIQISDKLVYDIPPIIMGSEILKLVNDKTNENLSLEFMEENVETEIVNNTHVINIEVANEDPDKAQMIARTIADATDTLVNRIVDEDYITIINEANLPTVHEGFTGTGYAVISAVGGVLIGFVVLLLMTAAKKSQMAVE